MLVDRTRAALEQQVVKRSWNPLVYLWIGWEKFSYFFAPHNGCQYCWTLRMFILGLLIGWHCTMWYYKRS